MAPPSSTIIEELLAASLFCSEQPNISCLTASCLFHVKRPGGLLLVKELPQSPAVPCVLLLVHIQDCTWSYEWSQPRSGDSSNAGSSPGNAIPQQHLWLVQGQCSTVFRDQPDLDTLPRVLLPGYRWGVWAYPLPLSTSGLKC